MNELISIREAAKKLNVTRKTLIRWDNEGIFVAKRFGKRRDRKYTLDQIIDFINGNYE